MKLPFPLYAYPRGISVTGNDRQMPGDRQMLGQTLKFDGEPDILTVLLAPFSNLEPCGIYYPCGCSLQISSKLPRRRILLRDLTNLILQIWSKAYALYAENNLK